MLNVVIVTDGPYGDRAYDTINEKFDSYFVEVEQPLSMFADDIEISEENISKLEAADILLTYTTHPDLTLEIVERLHDKVKWIIVAAWRGDGFKNQLMRFGNVTCPENMCDLEKNGVPVFDEFTSKFGRPIVKLTCENDKVTNINVLRSSPCGSTFFVSEAMLGQELVDLPMKAGLKLQHYPCRAPKMRLFSDEECKKEMAATLHKEAFENALKCYAFDASKS